MAPPSYDDRPDGKLDLGEFSKLVADLNRRVVRPPAPPPTATGGADIYGSRSGDIYGVRRPAPDYGGLRLCVGAPELQGLAWHAAYPPAEVGAA